MNRFVWRVRLARAVVPSAVLVVIAAGVVGASVLPRGVDGNVLPAPADNEIVEPREEYSIGDAPMYLEPDFQGLWAAGFRITHIDLRSNSTRSTESLPGAAKGSARGLGKVWVAVEDEEGTSRLIGAQLEGNRVVTTDDVEIEGLRNIGNHYLTTGHGAVWVTSADGTVQKYDPVTEELETFDIRRHFKDYDRSNGALLVAAGNRYVWFAATPGSVVAFDPETMEPAGSRQELGWNTVRLEFHRDRLLVLHTTPSGAHQIWQIEESSAAEMSGPIRVGKFGPSGVLVARGKHAYLYRWMQGNRSFIYKVDLVTDEVIKQQHVAKDAYEAFTVSGRYGWIGELGRRKVRRLPLPHLLID